MADTARNITLFDRRSLKKTRNRNAARLDNSRFIIDYACDQLIDRLKDIKREFPRTLVIGLRSSENFFTKLQATGQIRDIVKMDLAENLVIQHKNMRVMADAEYLPFKEQAFDLIISTMDLHSLNDLPGALIQARRVLKPDGVFLAAMLGGETLHELRQTLTHTETEMRGGASPRIFPFADMQQMSALMQRAGFALPVVDSEILIATYPSLFELLQDVRAMGEGNVIAGRDKKFVGKQYFERAATYYQNNFPDEGSRIKASFEIIFLIGWAPHQSQQKPLKPGSATARLADVLGTTEYKSEKQ